MRITVVGGGYVGLVSGACLAEKGHDVLIVERDLEKVDLINGGKSPIHEAGLDAILQAQVGDRLQATAELQAAISLSDLSIIAVGTPFNGDTIDLTQIEEASRDIGKALKHKRGYHVVVVKSTVVPGTTDDVVAPLVEQYSGKRLGVDFGIGMNPEFLREGCAVDDFMQPDRIVIGGYDEQAQDTIAKLYEVFDSTDKVIVNNRTAEMIKYTSNSLLATLISFSNEIGNLCAQVPGVDVVDVLDSVKLDKRLSPILANGDRIQPDINSYLAAGCGFGGSCFPKDVKALKAFGHQHHVDMPMLDAVINTNRHQYQRMLALLRKHYPNTRGCKVSVLGLAFKPETDDVRESPALNLIKQLEHNGASVTVYDPIAMPSAQTELENVAVDYADSLESAVTRADVIFIVTSWSEFLNVPSLIASRHKQPLVIDGRRMLAADAVARYEGIGLGDAEEHEQFQPSVKAAQYR
jgi:UDPglucose 6-dehydrogenase/GDP-mannose 6-dehydrogenase